MYFKITLATSDVRSSVCLSVPRLFQILIERAGHTERDLPGEGSTRRG